MFAEAAEGAHAAAEHAEEAEHHAPIIVQLVNHYFGEAALNFELKYTKPIWDKVLGFFGTTPEPPLVLTQPRTRSPGTR